MASTQDSVGVETAGISPLERRNSLEKHLQQRPDEQDLKVRTVPTTVLSSYANANFMAGQTHSPRHDCCSCFASSPGRARAAEDYW